MKTSKELKLTEKEKIFFKKRIWSCSILDIDSGCWIWNRSKNEKGYSYLPLKGRTHKAHRLSYAAYKGDIPPGILVIHTCDIPSCVNPLHLKLGSNADNMVDMYSKYRGRW